MFGDIQVAAHERGFHASIRHRSWGGLGLSSVDSVPARVAGATRPRRGRPAPPGCFVLLNERGPCRVEQAGRELLLDAGELTLIRRDEPYRIRFDEPNRTHVLLVPERDGRSALDAHLVQRHGAAEAPLLHALMGQLAAGAGAAAPAAAGAGIRLALDLLALSWPPAAAAPGRGGEREARLLELVERDLYDPALDAAVLGRALGVSARWVQLAFARRGTTLGAHLLEQRLQRAACRLAGPDDVPIGQLALELGFNELSHFCRSFRRRFGCSARDWRAGRTPR